MDVSGWTMAARLMLPDWCFPNRQVVAVHIKANTAFAWYHGISDIALPDPCMFWSFGWFVKKTNASDQTVRIGLRATVPANEAQMNTAIEVLPYLGTPAAGPNKIEMDDQLGNMMLIPVRKAMATGGLKLVAAYSIGAGVSTLNVFAVVSELPTEVSGYFDRTIGT